MTDWNAMSDQAFRQEVRRFYAEHFPAHLRAVIGYLTWAQQQDWYRKLYERGWAAPSWPREHGGMGLDTNKLLIFVDERLDAARGPEFGGIVMLGPVLMKFGSPAQQAYYLPRILSGEDRWAQGYSEPGAGSDLAGLRTEAVLDGDHFVVNGQKIWTTWGLDCTHAFVLVRTDKSVKKQAGISFLLIDLGSHGVTVRGIRNIAGQQDFCEMFFDNVRVPKDNLVGGLNQGWTVSKALVGHERLLIGNPQHCQLALDRLAAVARVQGLFDDAGFIDRFAQLALDVEDLGATYARFCDLARRGAAIGADVSMLKIWATETLQRINEQIVEAAGDLGATEGLIAFGDRAVDVLHPFYISRPTTIGAGTSEIQRNIMAKFVLELPG
ncbi:MAG: acyl-CoA dehydrogenase family protein [Burkholderiales bacterium]|nr:acyl-CoA dehydrogenase family protein [Burkholderiales bacterium]